MYGNDGRRKKSIENMDKLIQEATRRSEGRFSTENDDTDSVASSLCSAAENSKETSRYSGVSPMNRRRSVRIALRQESTMKVVPTLQCQSTVVMQREQQSNAQKLQRMETSTRWTHHRKKSEINLKAQDTIICNNSPGISASHTVKHERKLPKGVSKWVKYRHNDQPQSPELTFASKRLRLNQSPSTLEGKDSSMLLKKMSTTWGLRQKFVQTKLEDDVPTSSKTNRGANFDEVDSVISAGNMSKSVVKAKLKRKASNSLLLDEESLPKKSILRKKKTTTISKQVTVILPDEEKPRRKLKRDHQLSLISSATEESILDHAKRMKIQQSEIPQSAVYIPDKSYWPIHMHPQVIWKLPSVKSNGLHCEANSVYVNKSRCLIGHTSGTVLELNASVIPSRKIVLPLPILDVTCNDNKIVAASENGGIYDITDDDIKLIWKAPKSVSFGEKLEKMTSMRVAPANDRFAIGGDKILAVIDDEFNTVWQVRSTLKPNTQTWMVECDNGAVYHGHGIGLTKYNLSNGHETWHNRDPKGDCTDLLIKQCGVKDLNNAYIVNGDEVVKVHKYTGDSKIRYDQGAAYTGNITALAVGGGLVYAAGNKIVCYCEENGEIVFIIDLPSDDKIIDIQYFESRLFCLSVNMLHVLDFTENSIKTAMDGNTIECKTVTSELLDSHEAECTQNPLNRESSFSSVLSDESTSEPGTSKPKARRGKLKVKAPSIKFTRKR